MRLPLETVDLVSFDVFDTLLLRTVPEPADIWEIVSSENDMPEFAAARWRADHEAWRQAVAGGRDATMEDVYALLPGFRQLMNKELSVERRCLVADPEMVREWKRAGELGKRRVIVSDMYLPGEFVRELLRRNGIEGWDGFYLSCERGCRKDTGKLFELVLAEQGVAANRILHVGDNPISDVDQPRRFGFRVCPVTKPMDGLLSAAPFVRAFLQKDGSLAARRLVGTLAAALRHLSAGFDGVGDAYWPQIGLLFGAVLGKAYVDLIVRESRNRGLRRLLFVARDGYLPKRLFDSLETGIRTDYVYAPRAVRHASDLGVRADYARYLSDLNIGDGEAVGIVDGVSGGFSAQRMLSEGLERGLFSFYAVALNRPENGACLVFEPNLTLRWTHFAETLFMAPCPPTVAIRDGRPVWLTPISAAEQFKIDIYPGLADAAAVGFAMLNRLQVPVSAEMWLDWMDAFLDNMTTLDVGRFGCLRNANDDAHADYVPVIRPKTGSEWTWRPSKWLPLRRIHVEREGLRQVRTSYLFGLIRYKRREGPL